MEDRCICCGEVIPESRQVCPMCEYKITKTGSLLQSLEATPEEVERAYKSLRRSKENETD